MDEGQQPSSRSVQPQKEMMKGILAALTIWALVAVLPANAQTTGKISGTVVDAASGDPLPGVNVVIEGTTQGTATNGEGYYVIIGVRPGIYTISASMVGFAVERREGVRVNVDLTSTVDFTLREEVFEGEEIIVTAEAVQVRKDLTSSEARVTAETIDRLPVQELGQVLQVQAGVTDRDGLHIRGGRSSEVTVMVDGVPVTDNFDGSTAIQLENDGIQELQVISGTFNAEYGNAMSGIINVVTKEGRRDRIGGSVEVFSGSYLVPGEGGEEFLLGVDQAAFTSRGIPYREADVYSYLPLNGTHYYNLSGTLDGPVLTDRVTFFGHARYFKNDGWLYGARIYNMNGTYGDSSLVPMNTFEKLSWQGNLRFQVTNNVIVNVVGLGSSEQRRPYDLFWRWAPDGRREEFDRGNDLKVKLTHLVNPKTFYTLNVATFWREAESYRFADPGAERYNDLTINPPDVVEVAPGVFQEYVTGGGRFSRGGTDLGRFNRTTQSFFAKGDVTSQIAKNHLLKIGLEARLDLLEFAAFGLIPAVDPGGSVVVPFQPAIPSPTSFNYQQFDGVEPIAASAYVQDKMEFESFIVNAGLRLDYFDSRATVPADSEDPNIHNPFKKIHIFHDLNGDGVITIDEERDDNRLTVEEREAFWWKDTDPKIQISPRLGVAYPITAEGVIHFSYGHFLQIPTLNRLFENFGYKVPIGSGQYGPFGNPDLDAQRTVMYELGVRQAVGNIVFDVTGYYRDVRDWVSTSRLIETEIPGVNYVVYANRDYANTRGLTVSMNKAFANAYGFDVNYTFQVVEGSNSNPDEEFFSAQGNEQPKLALLPLSWDQRHKFAGSFYVGGRNWGASTLAIWGSGFPYTPSFPEAANVGSDVPPEFPSNSRRIPASLQVDLSAYYSFDVRGIRPRLFMQIFNVLDARNAQSVFADTGEPDLTFEQPFGSVDPGYFVRPDFYSEPRRMHLGIEFNF
jgi:hypothetical protein